MISRSNFIKSIVCSVLFVCTAFCVFAQAPLASFNVNVNSGCQPLSVQFINTSQNAVSYLWTFGNGNTSNLANPVNVYNISGTYTVTLTAYDAGSNSDTKTITNCVVVVPPPQSNFSASVVQTCQGYGVVQFTNLSTNFDSCIWDFGDGTKSSITSPGHVYALAGVFNVSLIALSKQHGCSDIKTQVNYITIHPQPTVLPTVDTIASCDSLYNFSFSATGTNAITWNWLFGDGNTNSMQNPAHIYSNSGLYNVSVITTSGFGCLDTAYINSPINVKSNPVPILGLSDSIGCNPLTVHFSTNTNGQWMWNFGDGDSAILKNTTHIYDSIGSFNVTLSVLYANGCSQTVYHNNIAVSDAPHPAFTITNQIGCAPLTVQFNNTTPGTFNWLWNFGDGTTSTLANPVHVYDSAGYFVPSLTATSNNGCTKMAVNNWYFITASGPQANFYADAWSGCPPLAVNFTDISTNAILWQWWFGDGDSSSLQHPSHTYVNTGSYTVTLIVTNAQGCQDTLVFPQNFNVASAVNNFIPPPPVTACAPFTSYFSDHSGAVSWLWNFGDGTTSTLQEPNHVFTQPGTYTVSLTTQATVGGCSQYIANYSTFIIQGGTAYFSHTQNTCPPYQAVFTDSSTNAVSWLWNFGDGTFSTLQNPVHTYPFGSHTVSLTITTAQGCSTTYIHNNGVQFNTFGAQPNALCNDTVAPFSVQYYANSTGVTAWLWDFGDGTTSTLQNPLHVFTTAGPFTISLTIGNDTCTYTYNYPPITFGNGGGVSPGGGNGGGNPPPVTFQCAPYTVNFSNPVIGAISWLWIFGDGSTSTLPNPMHSYTDTGTFNVVLLTTDSLGNIDTLLLPHIFNIIKAESSFLMQANNTCNGSSVTVSTVSPASSYQWNFGDGNSSSLPQPTHQYTNSASNYVISLNITDTNGCTSFITQSFYPGNGNPLSSNVRRSCAGDSVLFYAGTINYNTYLWNFGDGNTSNTKNPHHAYADSGTYTVILSVTDINNCVMSYTLPYPVQVFDPVADFTLPPAYGNCVWVQMNPTNLSTGADSYLWEFGDGTVSSLTNPYHYYTALGYHDITLTAFKNICRSSKTDSAAVYVPNRSIAFNYDQQGNCLPVTVSFLDQSVDAVQWHWDFGDGDTSNLQHPVHVYTRPPTGNVILSITDVNGCTVSLSKPQLIMSGAMFAASATVACNPASVSFMDSSINATSWYWDFGDGDTSTLQNPVHNYITNGYYNVQLIIEGIGGCIDTLQLDSILSVSSSTAAFTGSNTIGCVPLITDFYDQSINAISWYWDFGDGSTSSNQNPSHIYNYPGVYTVTLISTNADGCSDTLLITDYVTVRGSEPLFTLSDSSGCNPITVLFTDHSSGAVSWYWSFGDGSIDSVANPSHSYNLSGTFIVTLITTDSTGCNSSFSYPNPVQVNPMPVALFNVSDSTGCSPVSVTFNNHSTDADSVHWLFGDGNSSTDFNTTYNYTTPGTYYPMLIAINSGGCVDTFLLSNPIVVFPQPTANFTSDVTFGCATLPVQFTNLSSGLSNPQFTWDFGNGDTSAQLNPLANYQNTGFFDVMLTVTNQQGCTDVMFKNAYIRVFDQSPPPVSQIKSVSVADNSSVEIQWDLCPSIDLNYYTLYRFNSVSGVFDSIIHFMQNNVLMNQGFPVHHDIVLNTLNNTYSYRIQTTDQCGNKQDTSLSRINTTINLSAAALGKTVHLNWSPYEGCSLSAYEIYRLDNENGSYINIGSVNSSILSFVDSSTFCPLHYAYKIKATALCGHPSFVSWSDSAMAQPQSDIALQQVEIVRSTVVNNSYILTEWKPPVIAPSMVMGYKVLRSTDRLNYYEVATVTAGEYSYSDSEVDVYNHQYFYRIGALNLCNIETTPTQNSSSVLLHGDYIDFKSKLRWKKYLQWDTGVDKYVIEKQSDDGIWYPIKTVDGNTTEAGDE